MIMKKSLVQEEEKEIKGIFNRFRKRDFSGNEGLAIKNSTYQFGIAFFGKFIALLFTAVLARILMPELFGLYSLVMSTIFIMISFTDPGISTAIIKFVSPNLEKNKVKAKSFLKYFFKIKIKLLFIVSLILILSAKFISYNYYEKPIFLALLLGPIIIFSSGVTNFLDSKFRASNYIQPIFLKEIFFQITRFIFVIGILFLFVKSSLNQEMKLFLVILGLSVSYFATLGFLFLLSKIKSPFKNIPQENKPVSSKEKKQIKSFLVPLIAITLSSMLYNYIDLLILGKFVSGEFIGFYSGASGIVGSLMAFLGFSVVIYPIFSKLKKNRLERGFKKSLRIAFLASSFITIGVLIFSPLIIKIILGKAYLDAVVPLRIFSLLIVIMSLEGIYISYFTSKGKTKFLAKLSILSTLINVILTLILVLWLLKYGALQAVIGSTIATVISRLVLLCGLIIYKRKINSSFSSTRQ